MGVERGFVGSLIGNIGDNILKFPYRQFMGTGLVQSCNAWLYGT